MKPLAASEFRARLGEALARVFARETQIEALQRRLAEVTAERDDAEHLRKFTEEKLNQYIDKTRHAEAELARLRVRLAVTDEKIERVRCALRDKLDVALCDYGGNKRFCCRENIISSRACLCASVVDVAIAAFLAESR